MLSREEIRSKMDEWNKAWDNHDIDGVMELFHQDITFDNWTGAQAKGWDTLKAAWAPWFASHGGFRFTAEDLFIDEKEQKVLYQWTLNWPSSEIGYEGESEARRGVDVIHFKDGKIINKFTYSKTTVEIGGNRVKLTA